MSSPEMRKAVAYAIDEQAVLNNGYMGDGILTDTIYYPDFLGVEDTGNAYEYNTETAKALLRNLGFKDRNNDGVLEDEKGKQLILNIAVNKNNAMRLAATRIIAKNLESTGIKVNLSELSWKDYQTAVSSGKYDIIAAGFEINEQYDLREFFNGQNLWKYYNEELLMKANELERLYTSEEYRSIYADLKSDLLEELPYYSLCYRKIGLVGVSGFEAGQVPRFNDYYHNIETWKWVYATEIEKE
jgi:peptide/nickel transport system substrate-binding protein